MPINHIIFVPLVFFFGLGLGYKLALWWVSEQNRKKKTRKKKPSASA